MVISATNADVEHTIKLMRRIGAEPVEVEVKAAVGGLPRTLGETISAFANGSGGTVILGLHEDGFLPAQGFRATAVRDALATLCHEQMEPPVRSDIDIIPFEGGELVMLEVPPVPMVQAPCHVRSKGAYGGSFIRCGDGDRRLSSYEVTQLLSNRKQPVDDAEVVEQADRRHLDPDRVDALLRRLRDRPGRAFHNIGDQEALVRAGVLARTAEGKCHPTLAGLLALGTYPQEFFPQLHVAVVVLPADSLGAADEDGTRFHDNATCEGPVTEMLSEALRVLRRNMRTAVAVTDRGREDRHDYPLEVLRELIANAILHRDYSPLARGMHIQVELHRDKLVVKSPGGIYNEVPVESLGAEHISSTRNAKLARLLSDIPDDQGFPIVENRGSGLPRVWLRLREAGMSPPVFDAKPGHVHVTVPHHALLDPQTVQWIGSLNQGKLSNDQHIALALLRSNKEVSNQMLRAWGIDPPAATQALRDLVKRGIIIKKGSRRNATYKMSPELEPGPCGAARTETSASHAEDSDNLGTDLQAVLEAIRSGNDTTRKVQDSLGLTYQTTLRRINRLLDAGIIEATGVTKSKNRRFLFRDS